MDAIGYILLAVIGFVILKLFGGNAAPYGTSTPFVGGGTDPTTGAPIIDTGQFTGPIQSVPATKTANGQYYCPVPTKLYKDARSGTYLCINPTSVPAATQVGAAAAATAAANSAAAILQAAGSFFGPSSNPASSGGPAAPGTALQPTLAQLTSGSGSTLGTDAPVIDTGLPGGPIDLTALGGMSLGPTPPPDAILTLGYQADATTPVPAPIAGTDAILGSGSTIDPSTTDPSVTLPFGSQFMV